MAYRGYGGPEDQSAALDLFVKACDGELAAECRYAAAMFKHGQGAPNNVQKASELWAKGCLHGDAPSCYEAGLLQYGNEGQPRDAEAAERNFARACNMGHARACSFAGWHYFSTNEDEAAKAALEKACADAKEIITAVACANLATLYRFVENDDKAAEAALGKACSLAFPPACVGQAELRFAADPEAAEAAAEKWLDASKTLCKEKQEGETCLYVADWYRATGKNLRQRSFRKLGERFLTKDCEAGQKGACRILELRTAP